MDALDSLPQHWTVNRREEKIKKNNWFAGANAHTDLCRAIAESAYVASLGVYMRPVPKTSWQASISTGRDDFYATRSANRLSYTHPRTYAHTRTHTSAWAQNVNALSNILTAVSFASYRHFGISPAARFCRESEARYLTIVTVFVNLPSKVSNVYAILSMRCDPFNWKFRDRMW